MKIVCAPKSCIGQVHDGFAPFILYDRATNPDMGSAGFGLPNEIRRAGMDSAPRAWDFLSIALSVIAADENCLRNSSSDGWTRELELRIAVSDPVFWETQRRSLEALFSFLTGDIWRLEFLDGGFLPSPHVNRQAQSADSVCLLSGGMDSLIGALDLTVSGRHPHLVSQITRGDKNSQIHLAASIAGGLPHLQLNHLVRTPGPSERSQRARSIIFIAYAIIAATSLNRYLDGGTVDVFVPENGFVSLNVPLTPMRLGTLSTRTTHPVYIIRLQEIFSAAEINVILRNPYQFKTKGEILCECQNQTFLQNHVFSTTSCGRFARTGFVHCGRCVPCLVRRAAFRHWGIRDLTQYRYDDLSIQDNKHRNFEDVRAVAMAIERIHIFGFDSWVGGALNSAQLGDTTSYKSMIQRGVSELEDFLRNAGVL